MTTNRRPAGEKTRPLQVQIRAHEPRRSLERRSKGRPHIYSQFTLKNISDSFAVHDSSVCHYVSPIKKINNDQVDLLGERWMILIDYSLTKQKI